MTCAQAHSTGRGASGAAGRSWRVLALVGLMNVVAMVVMAVFIFIEKTTRFGIPAGRLAGLLMLAASAATLAGVIG